MKNYILLSFLLITTCMLQAQTKDSLKAKSDALQLKIDALEKAKEKVDAKADTIKYWSKGGLFGVNITQSSFTNWAAGGENAISGAALLNIFGNYKKDKITWDNNVDLAYGLTQTAHNPTRKNEDKIDLTSKLGRYAFYNRWYYTALLNFKTQFDNGYNYPDDSTVVSHFLAPGYVVGALGLDYKSKDNSFSFFVSPVTSKTTIVNDRKLANNGAYGLEPAERDTVNGEYVVVKNAALYRSEFGGYIKIAYKKTVAKNVSLETKLELFSNYLKNPQNVDVNWEMLLGLKVNKFINASISTQMIYDHDIPVPVERKVNGVIIPGTGPRLQFKEVIAVGLSFKF